MTEIRTSTVKRMAFQRGDRVVVIGADNARGRVLALLEDEDGVQYRVVYWVSEARRSEWLFAWEIAPDEGSATV